MEKQHRPPILTTYSPSILTTTGICSAASTATRLITITFNHSANHATPAKQPQAAALSSAVKPVNMEATTNLREHIEQYLAERDFAPTTLRTYSYVLNYFWYYQAQKGRQHARPTRADIISWKRHMKETGLSTCTIDLYIVSLKGFFRWLVESGLWHDNIVNNVRIETRHRHFKKKILTPQQVKHLVTSIDASTIIGMRDRLLINLIYTCGLRRIEAQRLNLADVDTDEATIMIQGKGYTDKEPFEITKECAGMVDEYITERVNTGEDVSSSSPLFVRHNNHMFQQRLRPDSISSIVLDRMKIAGLWQKGLSVHSLRHSAAVAYIEGNATLYDVSVFLRHKSADTSRNYTRYIEGKMIRERRAQNLLQKQIL